MQERTTDQQFAWWRLGLDTAEAVLVVIFQTSLIFLVPLGQLRPDCIFLFLAYTAITRPRIPCLVLAFTTGLFQDCLASLPYFGAHIISGLVIVSLIGLVRTSIPREKKFLPFLLVVLAGSLVHNFLYGGIIWLKGGYRLGQAAFSAGAAAFSTTLVSFIVLTVLTFTKSSLYGRHST